MHRLVGLLSAVLIVLVIGPAHLMAQLSTPAPIGGLTALPPTNFGPNLLQNPGFETLDGGLPVAWSSGAGWSADQLIVHSGRVSYRRAPGAGLLYRQGNRNVANTLRNAPIAPSVRDKPKRTAR